MANVPDIRIRQHNAAPVNPKGDYILYWMSAFRRTRSNFALQRAVEHAQSLQRPLLILEALRCDYPYASDRLHRFIIDGMAANAAALKDRAVHYHPYLERAQGAGKGLLKALAEHACLVVGDDFPGFFLPRMLAAAAAQLPVLLEAVDSNGLLPLRAADHDYPSAYAFRRFLQRELPGHLADLPHPDPLQPLQGLRPPRLSKAIADRWPGAHLDQAAADLSAFPIDHGVAPVAIRGGSQAARLGLTRFLEERLQHYAEDRNQPELEATSGLSPYLHFGQISSHEIFAALAGEQGWALGDQSPQERGQREGWWRMSPAAEAFLDQLVTWRELGYNGCAFRADFHRYDALPAWARKTLDDHAGDPRPTLYSLQELEQARTHDPLWNAAQRQLLREGRMHNYLRMLWGKKILEWSRHPRQALAIMVELNDRYALDGRDPNSSSGIGWCLGRYDRPWGPERPIFGKIRYMSSENTARKLVVKGYLARYAAEVPGGAKVLGTV